MSYANRKQMSSNRTAAIIIVALIHIALGYALVTGLAYNVIKKAAEDLKTFDVEDEPPPPPEEPPPPPEQNTPPPPQVVAPPPIVRTNTVAPPIISTPVAPPPVITPVARPAPPAPPAPPPPRVSQAAQRQGQPGRAVLDRRLSAVGDPQRGAGHDRGPADHRHRRPGDRLLDHRFVGLGRARQCDLQHPASPGAIHAGQGPGRQSDFGHLLPADPLGTSRRLSFSQLNEPKNLQ